MGNLYAESDLAARRPSQFERGADRPQPDRRRRHAQEAFAQAGGHPRFEFSRRSQKGITPIGYFRPGAVRVTAHLSSLLSESQPEFPRFLISLNSALSRD